MGSRSSSPLTHARFLPRVSDADILYMKRIIAQEFKIWDEWMLSSELFYMADAVKVTWKSKEEAIRDQKVYIGG